MITLTDARIRIGDTVTYAPTQSREISTDWGRLVEDAPSARREYGVITSVGSHYVFVRYAGDSNSKATRPDDLEWLVS